MLITNKKTTELDFSVEDVERLQVTLEEVVESGDSMEIEFDIYDKKQEEVVANARLRLQGVNDVTHEDDEIY